MVKFKKISFVRNNKRILKNINWEIGENENWVLLGGNGSGKSTLLSMIPAYIFPTSGDITVFGNVFGHSNWSKVKNNVGFVSTSLNNFLSTLNRQTLFNIVLSGKFNSIGIYQKVDEKDIEKALKIVDDFKLTKIKDSKFDILSQGEQRRTLIARAFMNNPKLMILDEPCAGLDITSREYLLSTLENSSKKMDKTRQFIYVTHQIDEIIPSVTHVAMLKNGEIFAKGEKKEVLTNENLSLLFDINVDIRWENERPFLIVK